MVRTIDRELRKRTILSSTINKHIKDSMAVASDDLANEFSLSSASIRHILYELEEEGYLTHPYTSAGRIPTPKGYRYYVDFLLSQLELMEEEKIRINNEYKDEIERLEDVLEKTSELVSKITRYTSIVSSSDLEDKIFYKGLGFILEYPEFQDLNRLRVLIKTLETKTGLLSIIRRDFKERVKVYIGGEELGLPEMENCAIVVSAYKVNKRPVGRLAILGPMRMEYSHIIPTLEYTSDILTELLDEI